MRKAGQGMDGLFDRLPQDAAVAREAIGEGAVLLRGFAAEAASQLMEQLAAIVEVAPFRHMVTPGGYRMSVAMTNCGQTGWVSDAKGYR